ncbi:MULTISPECIES: hypothetical protein [unclassified Nostoc]|uniref:hypothetical protein n=1 Tax=unclassified Nostoc TaxID=2593658 RepID=UPI002AD4FE2C|nr:hypothetical protein [Nostoc sp. DedQUE03]MDZ7976459.1 hypothetical protein [Nostoc sp. DedQUE03]MDZ8042782.1 hypothetical protein [Nostoc sp. DedQUE02]
MPSRRFRPEGRKRQKYSCVAKISLIRLGILLLVSAVYAGGRGCGVTGDDAAVFGAGVNVISYLLVAYLRTRPHP